MRVICDVRDAARLKSVLTLVVVLLATISAAPGFAQTVAGNMTTATGAVQLQRGATVSGVTSGSPVNVGDRVITGPGGHAIVTLTDGSQLELGESSNMVIDNQALAPAGGRAATQVSLFGGVLRSVVSATGGTPNFEVHTPNAVAAVRGTRFDTSYVQGEARPTYGDCRKFSDVLVYEGVVSLRNAATPAGGIEIPAGYEATVPCDVIATLPGPIGMTGAHSLLGGVVGTLGVAPPPCPVCPVMPPTSPPPLPPPPPPPTIP
ncbi:MAG TPA: FecR family protein [Candidatus Binataceae bacterium]|nr:FecR family protein [Candidatus Binataceae bacterium]